MIPKTEWQSVNQDLMAERRAQMGEPPTAEELLAYKRGELSPDAEERVRELLVCYPALARTLTETPDPKPGEPGYRSENEMTQSWLALRKRLGLTSRELPDRVRALQIWRALAAVAATVAIVSSTMLWDARNRMSQPRVVTHGPELGPPVSRGASGEAVLSPASGDDILLTLQLPDIRFPNHRLEILDASVTPPRSMWRSEPIQVPESGVFSIVVPRAFLAPGRYQIDVLGLDGDRELHVETYAIQQSR